MALCAASGMWQFIMWRIVQTHIFRLRSQQRGAHCVRIDVRQFIIVAARSRLHFEAVGRIAVPRCTSSGGTRREAPHIHTYTVAAPKIMSEPENHIKRDAHVKITWGDSNGSCKRICIYMCVRRVRVSVLYST